MISCFAGSRCRVVVTLRIFVFYLVFFLDHLVLIPVLVLLSENT